MDSVKSQLFQEGLAFIYGSTDILINMALAFVLGLIISYIYKVTHKGLSYSQSFMLTIVFVTFVVAVVMMVIGNNLARAVALIGALSIIRFRTVIKDTRDTAYIFLGLAAGTSSYFLAVTGVGFFSAIALTACRQLRLVLQKRVPASLPGACGRRGACLQRHHR